MLVLAGAVYHHQYAVVQKGLEQSPEGTGDGRAARTETQALSRYRNQGLLILVPLLALALVAVVMTVNRLVARLESDRRLIRNLDRQIRRAGRLANSVHLSHGPVHELKNKLVNAESTLARLREALEAKEVEPGEVKALADRIGEELQSGQAMAEKLHGNIRIPELESVVRKLDLNSLLTDLVDLLGLELYLNRITVEKRFQEELPPILGDLVQVRQVFMNLLLNAVAAVGSDGAITITTAVEHDNIAVIIVDDGPGIQEGLEERIFEPLFTTRRGNTGMGLPICVGILETMGGTIRVRNDPGRGASFEIRLPCLVK